MLDTDIEKHDMRADAGVHHRGGKQKIWPSGLITYKTALWLHDALILSGIALMCCLPQMDAPHLIFNFLLAAAILFYFFNLRLYSYHLIFSLRYHLMAIGQAFFFTLLTIAIIIAVAIFPEKSINTYLIPVTLLSAGLVIALNRWVQIDLIALLYPVGISFLVTGTFEIFRNSYVITSGLSWTPALSLLVSSALLLTLSRIALVHIVFNRILRRKFRRQVLLLGSNQEANDFARYICELNAPFWIAGTVRCRGDEKFNLMDVPNKGCLGDLQELPELTRKHDIKEIVVTGHKIPNQDLIAILDFCMTNGINAWFSPELMPIIDIKLHIDRFCGKPMIRLCSQKHSWLFYKFKHTIDALITLPAFVLQLPFFLALMIWVKLDSPGPAFYKARAIGKGGRPFDMYKFRSMYMDCEKTIHQQYVTKLIKGEIDEKKKDSGPLKIVNDPRVTKVGRILRKISLDELPQLINVLKGQMSLVGPRPCLPYEYDIYQDWHKKRTVVRPGITGLWQVTGRSEVLFEDMILLDLYYIYNSSIILDLQILVETIFVVIGKRGAF